MFEQPSYYSAEIFKIHIGIYFSIAFVFIVHFVETSLQHIIKRFVQARV